MIINENGYNKVQINATLDKAPDGTVIRKSLMINLREETVEKCWKLYSKLQKLLEKEEEQGEEVKKGNEKKVPLCPIHQIPMLLKQNKSNGNLFFGCPRWLPGGKGCNETLPYSTEEKKEVPADEDLNLLTIEQ